jgi:PPM family protein phosphatase
VRIDLAAFTHTGKVRPRNEDCIVAGGWLQNEPMALPRTMQGTLETPFVCMVLDGMGGQACGDVASQEAGRELARSLPPCDSEAAVAAAINRTNAYLYDRMERDPTHRGMGTTVAGLRIAADGIMAFNVGDSRVYRVQDGFLSQLSVDDVPAKRTGRSGLVTQSLGGAKRLNEIQPHVLRQPFGPWTYLLCSDGLYDAVKLEDMESALDQDLGNAARRLLERALEGGARDNVSALLVRIAD